MNEVASLELSKELYELSGWDEGKKQTWHMQSKTMAIGFDVHTEHDRIAPAYSLGYLLRKLPNDSEVYRASTYEANYYPNPGEPISFEADTPEDACAKLAIELIKQGVLKP